MVRVVSLHLNKEHLDKMAKIKPITKSDYLVVLATDTNGDTAVGQSAQANIWTSCSAFKMNFQEGTYNDGESYLLRKVYGPQSYDNITLSRPYDPKLHGSFIQAIEEVREQGKTFTLTITPGKKSTTQDGFVATSPGRKLTLNDCEVASFSLYEADGTSGEASMMTLEVAPNGHAWEGVTVNQSSSDLQNTIS